MSQLSLDTGPLSSKGSQAFTSPVFSLSPLSIQWQEAVYGWDSVKIWDGRLPGCVTWGSCYIMTRVIWCPSWPAVRWPSLASSWRWWPYSSNHLYPIYRTAVASGTTCHISGIGFFFFFNKTSSEGQTLVWGLLFFNLCWRQGMSVKICWICFLFILNWVTVLYDIFLSCLSHFVLKNPNR